MTSYPFTFRNDSPPPVEPYAFASAVTEALKHYKPPTGRFAEEGIVVFLAGQWQRIRLVDNVVRRYERMVNAIRTHFPDPDEFLVVWVRFDMLIGLLSDPRLEGWCMVTDDAVYIHPALIQAMAVIHLPFFSLVEFPFKELIALALESAAQRS